MSSHDDFNELVARITADVLRGMGYGSPAPAPSPSWETPASRAEVGSSSQSCSVDGSGWCNGCGHCAKCLPTQVDEFVDAGAARIGGLGAGPGIKDSLAGLIDHTLLKPQATHEDLRKICTEAKQHRFASVCVNAANVDFCARELAGSGVPIAAVVGFPLGASTPEIKAMETRQAIESGAAEIDMVINVGALKDKNYQLILETSLLNDIEKIAACALSKAAGAHYVKTATGFGPGGATVEDIALMRLVVGPKLGVKASGGIREQESALRMIQAGATRIGASASVEIVEGRKRQRRWQTQ